MKVLVVIPTQGKRPEMLEEAMRSVDEQTARPFCVIIASGPKSLAERINAAVNMAQCDAFLILADDDKLEPNYIERTVAAMERERVDIVYTNCHIFGDRVGLGAALGDWTQQNIDQNTVPLCTALCRKSAWDRAGQFADVPYYDWDFWWRCFYTGAKAHWLKEPLFWWRDHGSNETRTVDHAKAREFILNRHNQLKCSLVH